MWIKSVQLEAPSSFSLHVTSSLHFTFSLTAPSKVSTHPQCSSLIVLFNQPCRCLQIEGIIWSRHIDQRAAADLSLWNTVYENVCVLKRCEMCKVKVTDVWSDVWVTDWSFYGCKIDEQLKEISGCFSSITDTEIIQCYLSYTLCGLMVIFVSAPWTAAFSLGLQHKLNILHKLTTQRLIL